MALGAGARNVLLGRGFLPVDHATASQALTSHAVPCHPMPGRAGPDVVVVIVVIVVATLRPQAVHPDSTNDAARGKARAISMPFLQRDDSTGGHK